MNALDVLAPVLAGPRVVPVIEIARLDDAEPMARALFEGGLPAIEITLRTDCALAAVAAVRKAVPELVTGVGTVRGAADLDASSEAGAQFAVAPGATPGLLAAAKDHPLPLLPGAATASEMMTLAEHGYLFQKFFPAAAAGGAPALKALSSPLSDIRFCPTGGIRRDSAADYLAIPSVVCVGGSWMLPKDRVAAGDWDAIRDLAQAAGQPD